jgi:SPP1 family predicted phage head-tail adaptor
MSMRAGKLRHPVVIERTYQARNPNSAELVDEWREVSRVWASVEPLSGSELVQAQQSAAQTTHQVTIRYTGNVLTRDRIKFGTRILEIDGIVNRDERNEMLTLQCVERPGLEQRNA